MLIIQFGLNHHLQTKKGVKMDKTMYKQLIVENIKKESELKIDNERLQKENTQLRIALCNLRDEYLDMGGDPNQLELFDKDDVSQLNIFESPDGGKTIYQRKAGSSERTKISD